MSLNRFRLANPEQIQNPEETSTSVDSCHAAVYIGGGKSRTYGGSASSSPTTKRSFSPHQQQQPRQQQQRGGESPRGGVTSTPRPPPPPSGRLPEPMYTSWHESENQIDKISTMQRLIHDSGGTSLNLPSHSSRPSSPAERERGARGGGGGVDTKRLFLPSGRHQSPTRDQCDIDDGNNEEDSPRRHRRMSPLSISESRTKSGRSGTGTDTAKKAAVPAASVSAHTHTLVGVDNDAHAFNFSENSSGAIVATTNACGVFGIEELVGAIPAVGGVCLGTRAVAALAAPVVPSSHPYSALSIATPVRLAYAPEKTRNASKSTPTSFRKSFTSDSEGTTREQSRSGVFSGMRRGARLASNYLSNGSATVSPVASRKSVEQQHPMKSLRRMKNRTVGHASSIGKAVAAHRSRTDGDARRHGGETSRTQLQQTMKLLAQEAKLNLKTVKHAHTDSAAAERPERAANDSRELQLREEYISAHGGVDGAMFARRRSSAPDLLKNLTNFSLDSQETQISSFSDATQINADLHFSHQSHRGLLTSMSTQDSHGSLPTGDAIFRSWSQSRTPDPYARGRRVITRSDDEFSLCANLTGTSQTSDVTVIDKGPALMSSSLSLLRGDGAPATSLSSNDLRSSSRSLTVQHGDSKRDLTSPSFEHRGSAFSIRSGSGSFFDRRLSNSAAAATGGGGCGVLGTSDPSPATRGGHHHPKSHSGAYNTFVLARELRAAQRCASSSSSAGARSALRSTSTSSASLSSSRGSGVVHRYEVTPRHSLTTSSTASIISIDLSPVDTLGETNEKAFDWVINEPIARRYFATFLKQFQADHYLYLVQDCTEFSNLLHKMPGERIMKFKKIWQHYFVDNAPSHIELGADIYDELYDAACACDRRQAQAPPANIFDQVREGALRCIRMPFMKFLESDIYEEYDNKVSRPDAFALDWNELDRMEKGHNLPKPLQRDPSLYGNYLLEQGVPQKKVWKIVELGKAAQAGRALGHHSKPPTPSSNMRRRNAPMAKSVHIPAGAISVTDSMASTSAEHDDEDWLFHGEKRVYV